MAYLLQQLANAVPLSVLYATLAFGYVIGFALTKRADIAYGAIFAFSGHLYVLFAQLGWDEFWLVLPAALAMGAGAAIVGGVATGIVVGGLTLRLIERHARNAPIVAALGVLLVLMEGARLASGSREIWLSPFLNRAVPLWAGHGFAVTLTLIQLLNSGLMLAMIAAGWLVIDHTSLGRVWRAVADDKIAAQLCGISSRLVFVLAYAAASLYASVAGVLATSYYGTMDFGAGLLISIKIVLIAAAGGHSHPLRSAAGAAAIGFAETLWSGYGPVLWRDFAIGLVLVAVLVISRRERVVL